MVPKPRCRTLRRQRQLALLLPDEGRATRAQQLDEGLAVWSGLLAGQPFRMPGSTGASVPSPSSPPPPATPTSAGLVRRRPAPQKTASQPSLDRAARWQECCPRSSPGRRATAASPMRVSDDLVPAARHTRGAGVALGGLRRRRRGDSHGGFGDIHDRPQSWADQGATWWVESWWTCRTRPEGVDEVRRRGAGPPR